MTTADRYSRAVSWSDLDAAFVALSPEFPLLSGIGDTRAEAEAALDEAIAAAIEIAAEEGWPLPEPITLQEYSGQFRVRIPKSLHARLSARADREHVSLNSLVGAMLGERLGELETVQRVEAQLSRAMHAAATGAMDRVAAFARGTALTSTAQAPSSPTLPGSDRVVVRSGALTSSTHSHVRVN